MKKTLSIKFFALLLFVVFYQPTFVSGDVAFYDFDGNVIDKAQHNQIASDREKTVCMELRNGYHANYDNWKDPIKLRQKRIEQWRVMRSHYVPDSLPKNIEKSFRKNK